MPYATFAQLRGYLEQLTDADETLATAILERATGIVNDELGFEFAAYGASADRDIDAGWGGRYLYLPAHQEGSVTAVVQVSNRGMASELTTPITDYVVETRWRLYRASEWLPRTFYRVTAVWGPGPVPEQAVEVTLEVAVNIWRGRHTANFSSQLGADGGSTYNRALTWGQKSILQRLRARYYLAVDL